MSTDFHLRLYRVRLCVTYSHKKVNTGAVARGNRKCTPAAAMLDEWAANSAEHAYSLRILLRDDWIVNVIPKLQSRLLHI